MKAMSRKTKEKFSLVQILLTVVMLFLALTMLVPLLNIIANSFSDPAKSPSMSGPPC